MSERKQAITSAISGHGMWKVKFRDFMAGKLDLDEKVVAQPNQCDFGKWLEAGGKKLLTAAEHSDVWALHAEFHRIAASVIHAKKTGKIDEAKKSLDLGGAFTVASAKLTARMSELHHSSP